MCTIVILQNLHPEFPVVIAANREEFYGRAAEPPGELSPGVFAGRDVVSGGTWLGVTRAGFFVGLTNQRTYQPADPGLRSRGPIVADALAAGSSSAVTAMLEGLDPRAYNEFNLLYGDASGLWAAYARRAAAEVRIVPVPDGVHALPNDVLDSPAFPKASRMRQLATGVARAPWDELRGALAEMLADHHLPPLDDIPEPPPGAALTRERARILQAMCVHAGIYGTRSAAIVALRPGAIGHYLFTDGAPCEVGFREVAMAARS